jgi:hypothetical protein
MDSTWNRLSKLDSRELEIMADTFSPGDGIAKRCKIPQIASINATQTILTVKTSTEFIRHIKECYKTDKDIQGNKALEKQDGLWYHKSTDTVKRLYIPKNDIIRCKIISSMHDTNIAAHPGSRRTYLSLRQ